MTFKVVETPTASRQAAGLRGSAKKTYDSFLDELAAQGCQALGYRLTGPEPLPRLCVRHLRGALRVVVAFVDAVAVWIVLIGPHDDRDPGRDVYNALYSLVGVQPGDDAKRTKPSCCDDEGESPAFSDEEVGRLVDQAKALTKRVRRS